MDVLEYSSYTSLKFCQPICIKVNDVSMVIKKGIYDAYGIRTKNMKFRSNCDVTKLICIIMYLFDPFLMPSEVVDWHPELKDATLAFIDDYFMPTSDRVKKFISEIKSLYDKVN